MNIKLLTEQHLEFLSLKGGYTCSSESIHVKMPHCWKSHVAAHMFVGLFAICHFLPVNGTTGEGFSLTLDERKKIIDKWMTVGRKT